MSKKPIIIKVGGRFFNELQNALLAQNSSNDVAETPNELTKVNTSDNGVAQLLKTLATLQSKGQHIVLVHGGGEQVLARLNDLNLQSTRIDGLRVTPDEHMPIVSGVLAGELNKSLVAAAANFNISAVGISLADGNLANCKAKSLELGAVGEPTGVSSNLLDALFNANIIPIVASIGKDTTGRLYNVNADHAAICLAQLLQTELYFFADVPGVLDANKQIITEINEIDFNHYVQQKVITDGMIVKVEAALNAANEIKQAVTIASWHNSHALLIEKQPIGTQILPTLMTSSNKKESTSRA